MKHAIPVGWALALALLAACQQPSKQSSRESASAADAQFTAPAPKAWTQAFMKKSVLFADEIVIEGPQGIIDKTALRVEPELMDSTVKTIPDGLLQEARLKPGAATELHAFLDNWELVAFRRISILERVVPCDVSVRARGDARFVDQTTKAEQSGPTLSFEGKIAR